VAMILRELVCEDPEVGVVRDEVGVVAPEVAEPHVEPDENRPDVRTCAHCGERTAFRLDPLGSWAECTTCGHLA
jgi:hypothetical protein